MDRGEANTGLTGTTREAEAGAVCGRTHQGTSNARKPSQGRDMPRDYTRGSKSPPKPHATGYSRHTATDDT